jgi:hypothetical protein
MVCPYGNKSALKKPILAGLSYVLTLVQQACVAVNAGLLQGWAAQYELPHGHAYAA